MIKLTMGTLAMSGRYGRKEGDGFMALCNYQKVYPIYRERRPVTVESRLVLLTYKEIAGIIATGALLKAAIPFVQSLLGF